MSQVTSTTSGPSHYKEAERLLEEYANSLTMLKDLQESGQAIGHTDIAAFTSVLTAAQVHATLALAAATAAAQATAYDGDEYNNRSRSWSGVI